MKTIGILILGLGCGILVQYGIDARFVKAEFHSSKWSLYHNVTHAAEINEQAVKLLR